MAATECVLMNIICHRVAYTIVMIITREAMVQYHHVVCALLHVRHVLSKWVTGFPTDLRKMHTGLGRLVLQVSHCGPVGVTGESLWAGWCYR